MTIDFTTLALAAILIFGVFGWIRGVRRIAVASGGIFFAMAIISLVGPDLVTSLGHIGIHFKPQTQSDLFLAGLFLFTVYIVQLFGVLIILGSKSGPANRKERFNGVLLGLVNGFLIMANTMRYADPYLRTTENPSTGGWSAVLPLPHFSHPDAGTFSLTIAPTTLTITPSPLLRSYESLPTALILLFGFLVFVFLGTVYGRVIRSRS